jgi:hypothetical protein
MGELVLGGPRDADLGRIFRATDDHWHRTLRDLVAQSVDEGAIDRHIDPDDIAALMIVALKGLSLPTVAGFQPERAKQVFRQFERLLGLAHLYKKGQPT